MVTDFVEVLVSDLRRQEHKASLETCGFEIRGLRSTMAYEDFGGQERVDAVYVEDVKTQLREDFGASHIDIMRVRVRRRHPHFPLSIGTSFEHHQPSTAAHIDTTMDSAKAMVKDLLLHTGQSCRQGYFQILNVWKPLRGPLEDWPLAVCDQQTVDTTTDLAQSTILHQDYANHNCQVHYNKNQRWFYLSRQQPDEIMIFRQFDSRRPGNNGTPHSSFADPSTPAQATPRESVEVMAVLHFQPKI
ncbi:Fe(II)/2-oxoglutarate-dependent dioxygenase nvfI [Fulvia fulva]|uniref:Fe(II)/2-oxoglutarate-dependent dioxygenase nvfI n=1 Tax=Passalora fulva TaxID=5499 RepID=A0A9Q8PH38_PASFU|nr:Fe(II)/2-oxoglutarate-dependent dioxygenase nvfI [Fulvia fulva]KAK4614156.1 Fe(II)/2-oxoglutarate-dependent dioxygenase nvfI [Fulvia fulva]KAK4614676.1 Fe(II)/2-oxoglutarate-dependent dioxygenase nvfI [Fulvia fulva]UJO22309.1 Fe(II)/2-oxoglutarate-dependent dioxygenase nvfI [Fulvia fulva]WPV19917.1 Fe(II)/2-oxoglutarate-dependent dioxygenase nvfI [Fulvia fulva]WPV34814.1 Fe(II)/2-oxoglutarate-dependent dioxygenase nvfI [Fulvia fulva]